MERKHQVFVSSTYKDLIEERKEVIQALLELDCIPSGMELFPASDEDAWSLIKEILGSCDYYLLILAGKYGSINSEGVGYTEMEYDYAVSTDKPIISFLHENPDDLSARKVESSDIGKGRLKAFREKVQEKHCKLWSNAPDLGGKVSRSLVQLKKKHPSDGWVPGMYAADQKMLSEMEKMRSRIVELEMQVISNVDAPPANIDQLGHGSDTYNIPCKLKIDKQKAKEEISLKVSWDNIFSYCGTALTGECTEEDLVQKVQLIYWHSVPPDMQKYNSFTDIIIRYVDRDQIRVQLQALGLMQHGTKKRAVSDKNTYWKLTPYGEKYLIQIRAIRKSGSDKKMQPTADERG